MMSRVTSAKAMEACEILDVDFEELKADAVDAAYRTAAKAAHPDAGGTVEQFQKVKWAKDTLAKWFEAVTAANAPTGPKGDCRACAGTGFIFKRYGFRAGPRLMCSLCMGMGSLNKEKE